MSRFLTSAIILLAITLTSSAAPAPLSDSDFIGTWRVEPGTFVSFADRRQTMPTNFTAFALNLKADGSFIASNVPAGFFFGWPASTEMSGKWKWRQGENDDFFYFFLWFERPSRGAWSTAVEWKRKGLLSRAKPR